MTNWILFAASISLTDLIEGDLELSCVTAVDMLPGVFIAAS